MDANERQHWLSRNRPPRVQITYDVETLGSSAKLEIPFIVGVISDLAGNTVQDDAMPERRFVETDRDNFGAVMAGLAPTLTLKDVPKRTIQRDTTGTSAIKDGTNTLAITGLPFRSMEDFGPLQVIDHVPDLKAVMTLRQQLSTLMASLGTSADLDSTLRTQATTACFDGVTAKVTVADKALNDASTAFGLAADAVTAADAAATTTAALKKAVTDALASGTPYDKAKAGLTAAIPLAKAAPADAAKLADATTKAQTLATEAGKVTTLITSGITALKTTVGGWTPADAEKQANKDAATAITTANTAVGPVASDFGAIPGFFSTVAVLNPPAAS
ncbi:MAG TPA: type VI secretion system contractile sheath small subunit [Longimicrobium sp.]|jgi:type VI secretion system protein ImpB|uniref:type VI secretion system contractile sheath small subunit n=1 Tax=Longimicrobium sp. TaxID=2029185 RepID=UPI002ED8E713